MALSAVQLRSAAPKKQTSPAALNSGTLRAFAETGGMFDGWRGFKRAEPGALKGDALDKFRKLSRLKDTWSDELYRPKVYTANVKGQSTTWLAVETDHGNMAFVFDAKGKALASAFMPETGDDYSWRRGFGIDPYAEHVEVGRAADRFDGR